MWGAVSILDPGSLVVADTVIMDVSQCGPSNKGLPGVLLLTR
jgi:hypothetical protein